MTGARVNRRGARVIGWGLIYLVIAGMIGVELDWGRRIHPPLPVPKPAPVVRVDYPIQPEFTLLPLEQGFAETTARPMFTQVRRPPPPPLPPEPPKPAMQKGQFVLLGALITKGKNIALLREVATGKATRVEQGREIKGITVSEVLPEKVILTQYDDTEELALKIQPATTPQETPQAKPVRQAKPAPQNPDIAKPRASAPAEGNENKRSSAYNEKEKMLQNNRRSARGLPPQ